MCYIIRCTVFKLKDEEKALLVKRSDFFGMHSDKCLASMAFILVLQLLFMKHGTQGSGFDTQRTSLSRQTAKWSSDSISVQI